jgi:hypothetical protein
MKSKSIRHTYKSQGGVGLSRLGSIARNVGTKAKGIISKIGAPPSAQVQAPGAGPVPNDPVTGAGGRGDASKCSDPSAQEIEGKNTDRIINVLKMVSTFLMNMAKALWSLLKSIGTGLYQFFKSAPGEYITFIIFIILIFIGIGWLFFSNNSPMRRSGGWAEWMGYGNKGGGGGSGVPDWVNKLNIDVSWLNKFNINSNTDTIPKVTRKVLATGRCDDVNRIELNDKQCLNLDLPQTIEWKIDPKDIPEWDSLPTIVQRKISENGKQFTIYIPWELNGNKFSPNCSQAYFANGVNAGYLFTNMDGICKKKVLQANVYNPQPLDFLEDEDGKPTTINPIDSTKQCQV